MPASVLVTYATTYGSTQEVAESIADTLRKGGLEVDLQPMRRVRTLTGYRAIVLGAPLYMFRWHKDARYFVARYRTALAELPTAVFALGPLPGTDEKGWQDCRAQLDKELAQFPSLKPIALELFGGRYDPSALRFPYTLFPPLKKLPAGDIRDWAAIRDWASALALKLQPSALSAS